MKHPVFILLAGLALMPNCLLAQRLQQPLGRGVVAVYGKSNGSPGVEITWRRLAGEPENARYNVYIARQPDGDYSLLNPEPIALTNYAASLAQMPYGSYVAVTLVADGKESEKSKPFLLKDNGLRNVYMEIGYDKSPLEKTKFTTKFVWPCDLNGDGEYDYVVDRCPVDDSRNYYVEGYLADGTFLWCVDLGVNEKPCDGQNDNMCAYDIDCDGFGELIVQTSDGSRFWDVTAGTWGKYLFGSDSADSDGDGIVDYDTQSVRNPPRYMTVVDGRTGAEKATAEFMYDDAYNRTNKSSLMGDEYNKHEAHVGIAYLDGVHPALVGEWSSRNTDKVHMYRNCAFAYVDGVWKQLFKVNTGGEVFHMIRIFDADGDGRDEMSSGAYVMDHDGSTLYNTGISHGDRHRTSDIDPERPGLETFSIQQNAPDMLGMILFDAANGEPIKKWYLSGVGDVGRGECLDLDPTHLGWEMFSTMDDYQIYDAKGDKIDGKKGYFPTEGLWWDGQLDRENVNSPDGNGYNAMIVDYANGRLIEMAKESGWTLKSSFGKRGKYWGDIIGDWREELILIRERDGVCEGIVGFTTDYKTDIDNIYCLQQDPHYRGDCTTRGYYQTPNPGFYLGYDMPRPQLPPCMVASDVTDVFGISDGNAAISPRPGVKDIYTMSVKGQTLSLNGPFATEATLWKGQQGTLVINSDESNLVSASRIVISEGTVQTSGQIACGHIDLRARGTLAGSLVIDSLACEGALHYQGCRLMPDGKMTVLKISLPATKNLYVELTPGKDVLAFGSSKANIDGTIIFTVNDDLTAGRYRLLEGGDVAVDRCKVRGLVGRSFRLESVASDDGSCTDIELVVDEKRGPAEVVWTGTESGTWDYLAKNFTLAGTPVNFVEGDAVTLDDRAVNTTITLSEMMPVTSATFSNVTKDYTLNGSGGISGPTILKSGRVTVKNLNYSFEIGKAELIINNTNAVTDNPVLLTDTATISTISKATVALKGKISGSEGILLKSGPGQLNVTYPGSNSWKSTILQAGTLAMGAWNTTIGASSSTVHVTGNSTFTVFNNNSTSQVPSVKNTFVIDKDVTLTFHAGKRCSIGGYLKGEGTYTIDFPYVRGDVSTNCSQFEGVYRVTTSNGRFVNAMDFSKATLMIDDGAEVVSVKAGSSTEQSYTHKVGTLMGSGTLGNGVWNVARVVAAAKPLTVRGTLNLASPTVDVTSLVKGAVSVSTELQLFNITGKVVISGDVTVIPAQPNEGLAWDLSTLATDGVLRVTDEIPDGIIDVTADDADLPAYDLSGRRVLDPHHGVFIIGGKKIAK